MGPSSTGLAAENLFAKFSESPTAQHLARRLEPGSVLSCSGVAPTAQAFLAALLHHLFPTRPIIVVNDSLKSQEIAQQDITTWLNLDQEPSDSGAGLPRKIEPLFYPSWEVLPHESRLPHADVISERLQTLIELGSAARSSGRAPIVVASVIALLQRTFSPETLRTGTRSFARGERIDPLDLVEWLEDQGYEPEAQVSQKGELSLRGGILDLFPLTSPWPVRMEFFGDEIESLREFDPVTQISREPIQSITIPPAGEIGILKKARADSTGPSLASLIDYLPEKAILLMCEPAGLAARADEYALQVPDADPFFLSWEEFKNRAHQKALSLVEAHFNVEPAEVAESVADPEDPAIKESSERSLDLSFDTLEAFRALAERMPDPQVAEAQRREFFAQLHRWVRQGFSVHVFCNNDGERRRFIEIQQQYGLPAQNEPGADDLKIRLGILHRGFINEAEKLVVVTDAEIFGRYKIQQPRRLKSVHAQASRSALDIDFTDLDDGDFVVHVQHGIGKYLGLQILPLGAGTRPTESAPSTPVVGQECLVIEYAPHDPAQPAPKLYVPVTEAHLVSKYVGTGKARPPLNTLGGTRWAKARAQAETAVRDVASELLSIQAARESQPGHAFKADTPWQHEFESAFIYEETPDQLQAISATKADMERPKPMDRLICGDVGFGKTEVAIRAAFKAVMDGQQVAVLVPTTVLAQQHFNTFRERMADYPIRIELLSRFRTRGEQRRIIQDLAAGAVDIVIGTHRLVQPDIDFKNLALVIIDEEQRFGVLHKERFKILRRMVDVLSLSATPIPRTLYLALTGARDMSTIQTPPHDRLPVETIVIQYDERVIRDAIQRELARAGQVFFLHNRVTTIDATAQKLRALVPEARIVVGHGQMHSDDLESVMTQFVNAEADVLLSTTIIESGLDIPNANTIIIDRADRFGLSDLYQLRGRVGRYKHQAFAYLLLPRHAGLVADVRKRISAIKQYSTLGSGFKIAMRDLEIRGAGNLLGAEQSGHITAVGFELYCQLLKQSVAVLKGEKVQPRIEVQLRLDFLALNPTEESTVSYAEIDGGVGDTAAAAGKNLITENTASANAAYIPFNYVSDERQRIGIYRKLAQASDKLALQDLEKELADRFGRLPPPVKLLLLVGELKILASQRNISIIEVKEDKVMLTRNGDFIMAGNKFPRLAKRETTARLKEIRKLLLAL